MASKTTVPTPPRRKHAAAPAPAPAPAPVEPAPAAGGLPSTEELLRAGLKAFRLENLLGLGQQAKAPRAEAPAPGPQLSVHGHLGPASGEPGGGLHRLAAAGAQCAAIPEAAHAVVFFAHPVILQRKTGAIHLRQKKCRGVCSQRGQCWKCSNCQQGEAASAVHGAI